MQKSPSNTKSELAAVCKRLLLPASNLCADVQKGDGAVKFDPSNARYTLLVFVISIVTLALISCYKTTYKKQWEEKTNLVNNILCETPGIKNKDLLNNKNLLLALIVIQAFTVAVMILLTGSITGKFCLPIGGRKKETPSVEENKQSGGLLNSEEFLRTTE